MSARENISNLGDCYLTPGLYHKLMGYLDDLLHEEADELRKRSEELRKFRSYEMTQQAEGILFAADMLDPYVKGE